jgi:hypothetical protein
MGLMAKNHPKTDIKTKRDGVKRGKKVWSARKKTGQPVVRGLENREQARQ